MPMKSLFPSSQRLSMQESAPNPVDRPNARSAWVTLCVRQKMKSAFPHTLDRLPYLYRWLALSGAVSAIFYIIFIITARTELESLVLIPTVGWFIIKMLFLDTSRLRSIGWSPMLCFLSLLPPAALFHQILLFFLSPKTK